MTLEEVRAVLDEHREELQKYHVQRLRVFGSVARGEARADSDVDFLVDFSKPHTLFTLAGLKVALQDLLGCDVDVGTPDSLRDRVRDEVLAEAVDAA
jgi:hypothetical protein